MGNTPSPQARNCSSVFVGRERELGELRAGLDATRAGSGRLFLISGEPGIGKTRLAEEIAREAAASTMTVLWGRCWEGGGAPAYWPFTQVLRTLVEGVALTDLLEELGPDAHELARILPDLHPHPPAESPVLRMDPERARFRLFDAVAKYLRNTARLRPLLVIFDDLHDADEPSVEMLTFVSRALKNDRLLIVATYRDFEVRRSPTLARAVGALRREGIELSLLGLNENGVAALIEQRLGSSPEPRVATELRSATGGNPFFVDSLVRLLASKELPARRRRLNAAEFDLPEGVREPLRRRVAKLSKETQEALEIAAALGNEFDAAPIEVLSNRPADQVLARLQEASTAGLLVPLPGLGDRFRFSHALIRLAIYEELDPTERIPLHRRIADTLEQRYRDDLDRHVAELAYHFRRGVAHGTGEKAIEFSIQAGEAALKVLAYEEATRHWEAAFELMENAGEPAERRAKIAARLGQAWFPIDLERAIARGEHALGLFQQAGFDEPREIHAFLGLQLAKPDDERVTNIPRATEHLRQFEQRLGRHAEPTSELLECLLATTLAAVTSLHGEEGISAARRGLGLSEQLGNNETWVLIAGLFARQQLFSGRIAEALALLERAREKAARIRQPLPRLRTACNRSSVLLRLWDPQSAQTWVREFPGSRTDELPFHSRLLAQELCAALLMTGQLEEALPLVDRSQRHLLEGSLAYRRGDWERAEALWTDGLELCISSGARDPASDYLVNLAELELVRGHHLRAESRLRQALAISLDAPQVQLELYSRAALAQVCAELKKLEEAQQHLVRCREILSKGEDWRGLRGHIERAEAAISTSAGDLELASQHFEAALSIFRRYTLPWEEAETLYLWGRALAGSDRLAINKLDAAVQIYSRHGAGQCWIDRVLTGRPTAELPAAPSPLSPAANEDESTFRCEGDYWAVAYGGATCRLKDMKGMAYIAYLLAHPGRRIHAIDLFAEIAKPGAAQQSGSTAQAEALEVARSLGDAGEVIDSRARAEYRQRLSELRAEIAESERLNDLSRIERARHEIEFLTDGLTSAFGLGQRNRRVAAHDERARGAVTKSIRKSLERISRAHPALGDHLRTCIRTGYFCAYLPDPGRRPCWRT